MNSPTSLVANTAEEKRTPKWNAPLRVRQALNLGSRAMDGSGWQWEVTDRHGKLIAAELLREEAERFVLACNSFDALTEANATLRSLLNRYMAAYPAFRMMPIGAPGSQMRDEQQRLMALEEAANAALMVKQP